MLQPDFHLFPVLTTKRMVLRRIISSDAPAILQHRSDDRIMLYLDRPKMRTEAEALDWINNVENSLQKNEGITWGMSLQGEQLLIGTIGLWRMIKEHYRAEIGYMLMPAYHGKGIMQEAMETVLHYGLNILGLHSIEANVNPANSASIKLLEKNNFVREAYHRENYYYNGKFLDSAIYSLIKQ